jgi:hypothetical protein
MYGKSHIFASMVKSIGGITYTRNRYASIVGRARTVPVNVRSNPLETARSVFNGAVSGWKSLTDAQRAAWTAFAADTPWFNSLGDAVKLTGQAMYIAIRSAFLGANPAFDPDNMVDCPCQPGLIPAPLITFACCTSPEIGIIVTVENQHDSMNIDAVVRISPPQSLSTNFYNGPYRVDQTAFLESIGPGSSDNAEFCSLCLARYFFEVRAFDADDENNMSNVVTGYFDACSDVV